MLRLAATTDPAWGAFAAAHLDEVLLDHAHCEKKAAGAAVTLLFRYPQHAVLQAPLAALAREELGHFEAVLGVLARRGVRLRSPAARALRGPAPRARCAARSPSGSSTSCSPAPPSRPGAASASACSGAPSTTPRCACFYGELLAAEARHHRLYVDLACELFELARGARAPRGGARPRGAGAGGGAGVAGAPPRGSPARGLTPGSPPRTLGLRPRRCDGDRDGTRGDPARRRRRDGRLPRAAAGRRPLAGGDRLHGDLRHQRPHPRRDGARGARGLRGPRTRRLPPHRSRDRARLRRDGRLPGHQAADAAPRRRGDRRRARRDRVPSRAPRGARREARCDGLLHGRPPRIPDRLRDRRGRGGELLRRRHRRAAGAGRGPVHGLPHAAASAAACWRCSAAATR